MKSQSTVDKLIRMRLRAMANAYILQEEDPSMKDVPFDDRFGMLVDAMYNSRQTNKVKTLIKAANLDQPEASILDIDYRSGRDLDKRMVKYLASCEYIYDAMNVTITGATGSGKTYLACALGMAAIKQYISVQYTLLSDLLIDLETAKENRNLNTAIKGYGKP